MKNFFDNSLIMKVILITAIIYLPGTTISESKYTQSLFTPVNTLSDSNKTKFPEHYFRFPLKPGVDLNVLTHIVSLDNVENGFVYAFANEEQWIQINKLRLEIEELAHPSSLYDHEMRSTHTIMDWDSYPTYAAYRNMMWQFASSYPDICRLDTIGYSVQNRLILVLKISDNVSENEDEPEFFYTSSMHGDETVGYILLLRLADYLLSQYGQNTTEGMRATRIINELEIWVNPLANPDGTYRLGGDTTVNNATRFNANNKDLNRNFPDRISDTNNVLTGREAETQAMMRFASKRNISMSANFHGGTRVVNYPWDNGAPSGQYSACPDDAWFIESSLSYSLTNPDLMSGSFINGITNGCEWYAVFGGRQDWIYRWHGGRETTIELWDVKNPPGSVLPQRWTNNKESLLAYMEQTLKGIRGIVTDAVTSQPVRAKIFIRNFSGSYVNTDSFTGDYHCLVLPGTYGVIFTAPGYVSDTVNNVTVEDSIAIRLNHVMNRIPTNITSAEAGMPEDLRLAQNYPNPFNPTTIISYQLSMINYVSLNVYDALGKEVEALVNEKQNPGTYQIEFDGSGLPGGVYFYRLTAGELTETKSMMLLK
ncbi:MAG: T9SS type A sorting domain-containing protein [Ignavibacteria bacterium]|nr:T9SS type A sorting domain-containing protein [Ignavibacteria bacterium]